MKKHTKITLKLKQPNDAALLSGPITELADRFVKESCHELVEPSRLTLQRYVKEDTVEEVVECGPGSRFRDGSDTELMVMKIGFDQWSLANPSLLERGTAWWNEDSTGSKEDVQAALMGMNAKLIESQSLSGGFFKWTTTKPGVSYSKWDLVVTVSGPKDGGDWALRNAADRFVNEHCPGWELLGGSFDDVTPKAEPKGVRVGRGAMFEWHGEKYILAHVAPAKYTLVSVRTGNRLSDAFTGTMQVVLDAARRFGGISLVDTPSGYVEACWHGEVAK